MNADIKRLNARLGERLGYRGENPRFAWLYAPEVFYFWRPNYLTSLERHCWAERLGRVWVLCQFRRPQATKQEWWDSFHGQFPYPDKGMYYAHPETALGPGQLPGAELTAMYVRSLEQQVSKSYGQQLIECNDDLQRHTDQADAEWDSMVADCEPAFDNWHSGTKNGVEFQVPGLRQPQLA